MFDFLLDIFRGAFNVKDTNIPAWRQHRYSGHYRKSRTPFRSSRQRGLAESNYDSEKFLTSDDRNERFREIRKRHSNAVKYSTVENGRSVFVVAWPRS